MNNEGLLRKIDEITHLTNRALKMINIFNPETEVNFFTWLNRFEYVADVIEVPNDKMIEFFGTMVDMDVHKCVRRTFSSVNFVNLGYKNIINKYLLYFATYNENDFNRIRFKYRCQYEKETIQKYAESLRKLSSNFSIKSDLEKELCKQFFIGIRDDDLRNYLTETPYFSFDGLVTKAIEFEENNPITHYLNKAFTMINIYNSENSDMFYMWFNKYEFVVDFLRVPNKKMMKFFNEMVDNSIHTTVKKCFPSVNFSLRSYEEVLSYYIIHFAYPATIITFHRKRFYIRNQYEKETISKYADNLRKILNKCFYIINVEDKLLEQFINGIRIQELRTHLKQNPSSSFIEILRKAIEFEKAYEMRDYVNQTLTIMNTYNPMREGLFCDWLNKFEFAADYFGIPNEEMAIFFDAMIENDISKSVKQTFPCVNFSELSYEKIINYYLLLFSPSNECDQHRKRFMIRNQYERETIEKYAVNLWKIFKKCNFTINQEKNLITQFIKGIRNEQLKKFLSTRQCRTFDYTVKMAIESARNLGIF